MNCTLGILTTKFSHHLDKHNRRNSIHRPGWTMKLVKSENHNSEFLVWNLNVFLVVFLLFLWPFIKKVRVLWFHEKMWSLIIFLYVSNSFIRTFYLMRLNFCKNSQCGNLVTKLSPTQGKMDSVFAGTFQNSRFMWQTVLGI